MTVIEVIHQLLVSVIAAYIVVASDISCPDYSRFIGFQNYVLTVIMVIGIDWIIVVL
ncbi:hypothetical protein JCM11672_19660 [Alkaliphilus crotonatoxidans]